MALVNKFDEEFIKSKDLKVLDKANKEICAMGEEETSKALFNVLRLASTKMKNGYNRSDN